MLRQAAQQQQFSEHYSISLDAHTDWDAIFGICRAMSLFASRQTLLLIFPENGPTAPIGEQLTKLATLLHEDILLILRGPRLTKAQENSARFKALSPHGALVSCQTPEQAQLPRWVATRAKAMKLELDDAANQLLCYCYEGNLLALSQALERLSLLHPDGKLTLPRVEQAVNDAAHFTPFHWLDALLAGKSKRAAYFAAAAARGRGAGDPATHPAARTAAAADAAAPHGFRAAAHAVRSAQGLAEPPPAGNRALQRLSGPSCNRRYSC